MSIEDQRAEIKNLLQRLGDDYLMNSHTTVLISFMQMLDYIQSVIEPVKQRDIRFLLETYTDMAQKYYVQFELTLLKDIQNQGDAKTKSELAMSLIDSKASIESNESRAMQHARELLERDLKTATDEHQRLMRDFPALLQDALDKLRDEWQRLGTIAVSSQALMEDQELIQSMETVVEVAAYSIGIEAQRIVVIPGKEFALYFFSYMENFIVFTVPIYSVQAPWEWSIFWHELAGHQVRWLEKGTKMIDGVKKTSIEIITKKLEYFYEHYKGIKTEKERDQLLVTVAKGDQFGYDHLKKVFSADKLDLTDLGNFDHQFERVMSKLPESNQFKLYEEMKTQGWCVDWFKELFEDAWSVLTFRQHFLSFLQDILSRHNTVDVRHPKLEYRLAVASELLRLAQFGGEDTVAERIAMPLPDLSKNEKIVIRIVSKQLLRFLSLLAAASYKIEETTSSDNQNPIQQNYKIFQDLQNNEILDIFEGVKDTIQEAIRDSREFHQQSDPVEAAKKCAKDIIDRFSKSAPFETRRGKKSVEQILKPSYEELLKDETGKDKDYKNLLGLSFYDTDFGVASVANVYYRAAKKFDTARLNSVPEPVTHGEVAYESGGVQQKTSIDFWNTAAVSGFKI